jgi:hypothetical protein
VLHELNPPVCNCYLKIVSSEGDQCLVHEVMMWSKERGWLTAGVGIETRSGRYVHTMKHETRRKSAARSAGDTPVE